MSLESLESELGATLTRHEAFSVDDRGILCTARPAEENALARTLQLAGEHALAVIPRGGGTHLELGNLPLRADLLLDTGALHGVTELDASEGVCQVRAGTCLGDLRKVVAETGWEVPLDAPDASTLGGVLACSALGPRSAGYGLPRDVVLGLSLAHASGSRTHCGGRVVKNVTGYDMAKLYTGSLGTLGVITGAWLRLRPRPERVEYYELELPTAAVAEASIAIARRGAVRACAVASASGDYRCVVELAGEEVSVAECAALLRADHAARPSAAEMLDAVCRRQTEPQRDGMRFRIGTVPSRLAAVLAALARAEVAALAYPALGLVYAFFEPGRLQGAFAVVEDAAEGGPFCCEAAPPERKRGHDVFGDLGGRLPLLRALKQRFDPDAVLNPGRFAGRL